MPTIKLRTGKGDKMFFGKKPSAPEAAPSPPAPSASEEKPKKAPTENKNASSPEGSPKPPVKQEGKKEPATEKENEAEKKEKRLASLAEISAELDKRQKERDEALYGNFLPPKVGKFLHGTAAGKLIKSIAAIAAGATVATAATSIGGLALLAIAPVLHTQGIRLAASGGIEVIQTLADLMQGKNSNLYAEMNAASADLEKSKVKLAELELGKDKADPEVHQAQLAETIKAIAEKEKTIIEKHSKLLTLDNKRKIFRRKGSSLVTAAFSILHGVALGTQDFDNGIVKSTNLSSPDHKMVWSLFKDNKWNNFDFLYNPSDSAGAAMASAKHTYDMAGPLDFGISGQGHIVGQMSNSHLIPSYFGLATAALGLSLGARSNEQQKPDYTPPSFATDDTARRAEPESKEARDITIESSASVREGDLKKKLGDLAKEKEENKKKLQKLGEEIKAAEKSPQTHDSDRQLQAKRKEKEKLEIRQKEIDTELKKYEKVIEIQKKIEAKDQEIKKNQNEWNDLDREDGDNPDIAVEKKAHEDKDTELRNERKALEAELEEELRKISSKSSKPKPEAATETSAEKETPKKPDSAPAKKAEDKAQDEEEEEEEEDEENPETARLRRVRNNFTKLARDESLTPSSLSDTTVLRNKLEVAKSGPIERAVLTASYNEAYTTLHKVKFTDHSRQKELVRHIKSGFISILEEIGPEKS